MLRSFIKAFMVLHTFIIRTSRGRIGTRLLSLTFLLLHTIGRRSGEQFVIPISYFQMDGYYFLVGSNWGKTYNAAWYYNLLSHPCTTIEVNGREFSVEARQAEGQEYARLWREAVGRYPPYQRYKETTQRHIPIMVLRPVE
jgi:deazaflavin-dependent oxidoreductase (nitroreductase family)